MTGAAAAPAILSARGLVRRHGRVVVVMDKLSS